MRVLVDRQLRLVHLQPRPVPGRARRRARGRAQRRGAVDELLEREPDRVVVSPGPCTPDEAGISLDAVRRFPEAGDPAARRLPRPPGARAGVRRPTSSATSRSTARRRRSSTTGARSSRAFRRRSTVGRYHSLVVDPDACPTCSRSRAAAAACVMGVRHRELPAEGVQFHPESVLTDAGHGAAAQLPCR